MRLLVLGGTVFLSEAVAVEAVARGHEVVCACRGASGVVPDGAAHLPWDRDEAAPSSLADVFDAVVDVGRSPSQVRRAVEAVPSAHWVFVSSVNAYADLSTPDGTESTTPTQEPLFDDADWASDSDVYGRMKVACERIVAEHAASATIVRPGLIVGPGDPSGRFAYWPRRLAQPGRVAAPGSPDRPVQVVDVRDLAAWIVDLAERRRGGVFDAVGDRVAMGDLLRAGAADVDPVWLSQSFLVCQGVEPWSGPGSIPLWLPSPEYDGMLTRSNAAARSAGLTLRPIEQTWRDVAAWLETDDDAPVTGIDRDREAELLAAWDRR